MISQLHLPIICFRHLLSDQSDPFNRSPLSMDQIKPNDELRERILEWVAQRRKSRREAVEAAEEANTST